MKFVNSSFGYSSFICGGIENRGRSVYRASPCFRQTGNLHLPSEALNWCIPWLTPRRNSCFVQIPRSLNGYRCRCEARSPLVFEFMGDPALKPVVPMTAQEAANWEAKCAGCGIVHLRLRRPKAGLWRCKCAHRSELTWRFRSQNSSHG